MLKRLDGKTFLITAFFAWALFSFISNSMLAIHHVLIVLAALFLRKNIFAKAPRSAWALLAFFAVACLSVAVNWGELAHPAANLFKAKYPLFTAILAFMAYRHRDEIGKRMGLIFALFIASFFAANIFGTLKFAWHYFSGLRPLIRLSGFFGMIMSYAYTAVIPILLMFALLLFPAMRAALKKSLAFSLGGRKGDFIYSRAFLAWALVAAFVGMALSVTRGEILGVLVAFPILFFFTRRRIFLIGIASVAILVGAAYLYTVYSGSTSVRLLMPANDTNNTQRWTQLSVGLKAVQEKPLLGIGFRSFEERDPGIKAKYDLPHKDFVGHAHNNYMEVLATTGILGLIAFLAWIALWLAEILKMEDLAWKSFFLAVWVAFLVTGLTQSTFIDSEYAFTLFAVYALSCGSFYLGLEKLKL